MKRLDTDVRILDVEVGFSYKTYRATLKFGGSVKGPGARSGADLHVTALVETRDGRRAVGHGSMVLGSSWSWPSQVVPSFMITDFMRNLALRYGGELQKREDYGHPMEHALETEALLLELLHELGVLFPHHADIADRVNDPARIAEVAPGDLCLAKRERGAGQE